MIAIKEVPEIALSDCLVLGSFPDILHWTVSVLTGNKHFFALFFFF